MNLVTNIKTNFSETIPASSRQLFELASEPPQGYHTAGEMLNMKLRSGAERIAHAIAGNFSRTVCVSEEDLVARLLSLGVPADSLNHDMLSGLDPTKIQYISGRVLPLPNTLEINVVKNATGQIAYKFSTYLG